MNIFKAINAAVQMVARTIAFVVAISLAFIGFLIYQVYKMNGLVFTSLLWTTYKVHYIFSTVIGWIMWVPTKMAQYCLMFALDISRAENQERIDDVMKEIERQIEEKQQAVELRILRDTARETAREKAKEHDPS